MRTTADFGQPDPTTEEEYNLIANQEHDMNKAFTRCPACNDLYWIVAEGICENPICGYATRCHECKTELTTTDYDPELQGNCSAACLAETLGWVSAGR